MGNLNLLIVTYHFPPDGAIGGVRPYQFARLLPEHGIETWVLTVQQDYAERFDASFQPEGIPESRIIRTQVYPSRRDRYLQVTAPLRAWVKQLSCRRKTDKSGPEDTFLSSVTNERSPLFWKCFTEWLSYPDWYAGWFHPAMEAIERLMGTVRFSAICSTSPPRTPSVIALVAARRYRLPWILDLRDPWLMRGKGWDTTECPLFRYLQRRLFSRCLSGADVVIANTPLLGEEIKAEYPLFAPKVEVLPNGVDDNLVAVTEPDTKSESAKMVIVHLGAIYGGRTALPFLEGLSVWLHGNPAARNRIEVWFYGEASEDIEGNASRLGISDIVCVRSRVDRREVSQVMEQASVLLLLAQNQPLQVPGKTYEYIATGKPIIALTERNSATGALLETMPLCYVAETAHDLFQILDLLWKEYTGGKSMWCSRSEFLSRFRYARLAADLAQIVRRITVENGS